jgi:tyrosine-protein kinase Etk/Wzc
MKIQDLLKELEEEEGQLKSDSQKVNYKLLFYKYFTKWHVFVVSLIICVGAAVAYGYIATPQYYISTKLLLKDEKKGADFTSNAVISDILGFNSSTSVENEAEVFKAEHLMVKVFEELNITNAFYIPNGWMRWKEIYGSEVPVKVTIHKRNEYVDPDIDNTIQILLKNDSEFEFINNDGKSKTYRYGQKLKNYYGVFTIEKNPNYKSFTSEEFTDPLVIAFYDPIGVGKYYSTKLNVNIVNKLASVIELSIMDEHPVKGKEVLQKLIEMYNREVENDKNNTALNTINFIDQQLVGISQDLEFIEKQAESYKVKNAIMDFNAEAQLYLNNATTDRKQLSELSIQIEVLESIEDYLLKQGTDYEMVPSTLTIQDPTLSGLIENFNMLQRERERMLRTTQPSNPIVINLNQQLTSLKSSILENLRNIKRGLEISRDNLRNTSIQTQNRASRAPTLEREFQDISRQQGIKQEHYLFLIQKREEAVLTLAATSMSNSKVIQPPTPTDIPVSPNKKLIYAMGLILGFAFPLGFIYALDLWQQKVQFRSDVEKLTSTKILGEISRNKSNQGVIAIAKNKRTMIAEQFRFIRSSFAFFTYKKPNKIIMVSSGMSGEGKTFFSLNYAISLAITGKKTVVLEFDLRRPALIEALKLPFEAGLSDYLQNEDISLDTILKPIPGNENVFVIGCGAIPENPAELMMSERLVHMLEKLSADFDHIIIDTAPVGLVSDAFVLSEIVDVCIFIVRYDYSTNAQVRNIEEIRKEGKFKIPMIVLNDAKLETAYGYGATYGKDYYQK